VVFASFVYKFQDFHTKKYDIRDTLNHLKIKQQYNEYVMKNNIL